MSTSSTTWLSKETQWSAGELNPDFLGASQASFRVGPASHEIVAEEGLEPSCRRAAAFETAASAVPPLGRKRPRKFRKLCHADFEGLCLYRLAITASSEWDSNPQLFVSSRCRSRPNSNRLPECPVGIEPTSLVWKTRAFAARPRAQKRKERELNPQGIAARPFSGRLPSPLGLPFRTQQKRPGVE